MKLEYKLSLHVICFLLLGIGTFVTPTSAYEVTVHLEDINSATTEPPGSFRWLDVANQLFDDAWIDSYDYTQADDVTVTYEIVAGSFGGTLTATNLKPNFAYQLKLNGIAGTPSNEDIGLAGRWWQEQWNGTSGPTAKTSTIKATAPPPAPMTIYTSQGEILLMQQVPPVSDTNLPAIWCLTILSPMKTVM
jgi:hypothetical protein